MEKNKQAEILKRVLELEKQIANTNCALERLLVEQYVGAPVPPTCEMVVREYPKIVPEVQFDKVKAIVPSLIFWPWFLIYYFGIWNKEKKADIERIRNSEEYKAKCDALDAEFDNQQEIYNKEYEEKKRIYDTETLPQYEKALHEWEEQHKEKVDKTRKELHAAQKELHEIYNTTKIVPVQYSVVLQIIYSFMLHFIYNHFQDYPKCHITLFKPDYAHKILLSKNEAHYLTRMRLLTARTFGFSVTYD